uniref:Uncharacterized protein n=1 Tax=Vespula pensylvanica TaxID=30213 RepID=A0A834N2V9_VESPE|nr:hypothetical protein H0235_016902 [Vespula pensylvanica]
MPGKIVAKCAWKCALCILAPIQCNIWYCDRKTVSDFLTGKLFGRKRISFDLDYYEIEKKREGICYSGRKERNEEEEEDDDYDQNNNDDDNDDDDDDDDDDEDMALAV